MKYITTFEVNGNGNFPTDMLRYDNCMPATHEDVQEIMETANPRSHRRQHPSLGDPIKLVKHHDQKDPNLTQGRWRSFLWGIDSTSIVTVKVR